MPKILFPSWRYHRTEPAVIVESQEESDALGAGWSDSYDFSAADPAPEPAAAADLTPAQKAAATRARKAAEAAAAAKEAGE